MAAYCSVDGCSSKIGTTGLSFFRCPKNRERCQTWKNVLGFVGAHRYANLTPEQSFVRVKICSLHFTSEDYVNTRLNCDAVPSLLLPQVSGRGGMSVVLNHNHTKGKNKLPNNNVRKRRTIKSIDQVLNEEHVSSHDLELRLSRSSSEIVPSETKDEVSSSLQDLAKNELAEPKDLLEIKYELIDDSDFVEDYHGIKIEQDETEEQYPTDNTNYDVKLPELCAEWNRESTSSASSIYSTTVQFDSKDSLQMDEYDRYGQLVALQLRQMTLKNSVEAQGKINELLTAYRLKDLESFNRN